MIWIWVNTTSFLIIVILCAIHGPIPSESCLTSDCMINLTIDRPTRFSPPRRPPSSPQSLSHQRCVTLHCTSCDLSAPTKIIKYYKNKCFLKFRPTNNYVYCCHQKDINKMKTHTINCSLYLRDDHEVDEEEEKCEVEKEEEQNDSQNEQNNDNIVIGISILLALIAIVILLLIGVLRKLKNNPTSSEGRRYPNMTGECTEYKLRAEKYVSGKPESSGHVYAELEDNQQQQQQQQQQLHYTNNIDQHLYEEADKYYRGEGGNDIIIPFREVNKGVPKFQCIITPPEEDQQIPVIDRDGGVNVTKHTQIDGPHVPVENSVSGEHVYGVLEQDIMADEGLTLNEA